MWMSLSHCKWLKSWSVAAGEVRRALVYTQLSIWIRSSYLPSPKSCAVSARTLQSSCAIASRFLLLQTVMRDGMWVTDTVGCSWPKPAHHRAHLSPSAMGASGEGYLRKGEIKEEDFKGLEQIPLQCLEGPWWGRWSWEWRWEHKRGGRRVKMFYFFLLLFLITQVYFSWQWIKLISPQSSLVCPWG